MYKKKFVKQKLKDSILTQAQRMIMNKVFFFTMLNDTKIKIFLWMVRVSRLQESEKAGWNASYITIKAKQ